MKGMVACKAWYWHCTTAEGRQGDLDTQIPVTSRAWRASRLPNTVGRVNPAAWAICRGWGSTGISVPARCYYPDPRKGPSTDTISEVRAFLSQVTKHRVSSEPACQPSRPRSRWLGQVAHRITMRRASILARPEEAEPGHGNCSDDGVHGQRRMRPTQMSAQN